MKRSLFVIALGAGIGYILGARAGRERYDLIVEKATGVWEDPRVARARSDAARYAREQAPVIRDRAQSIAKAAPGAIADTAKATATAAKDVADRAVTTARGVADTTASAATTAADTASSKAAETAAKLAEIRDDALEDDDTES